jgi:hypothetical protein
MQVKRTLEALRAAGLEPEALLSAAGLNSKQMDDPRSRIDVKAQINLLNIAADALKDDFLGFHLAREFEPREVGLIHYVIASSSTLAEAMGKTERYCRPVNGHCGQIQSKSFNGHCARFHGFRTAIGSTSNRILGFWHGSSLPTAHRYADRTAPAEVNACSRRHAKRVSIVLGLRR